MKKLLLLLVMSIFFAVHTYCQTNATNFNTMDCDGINHDLFTELESNKVIVIAWVMPCGGCVSPARQAYTVAKSYSTSNPGQVLYYMVDDYADTSCSLLESWGASSGMGEADAYFSDASISMSDYGQPGMPKIVVVAGSDHLIYYNENYTAVGIGAAIDQALDDVNNTSSVGESNLNELNLNIFPNPSQGATSVTYTLQKPSIVAVDILNIIGENVVKVSNAKQNAGTVEFQFDSGALSNGMYLLRVKSKKASQTVKFSVAN